MLAEKESGFGVISVEEGRDEDVDSHLLMDNTTNTKGIGNLSSDSDFACPC